MKKLCLLCLVFAAAGFAGCLADNIVGPIIVPANVLPPQTVFYESDSSNNLQIRWLVSPTYTQANFRGYYVKLFESDSVQLDGTYEDSLIHGIDSVVVPRSDTVYTFSSSKYHLYPRRYTAEVWGVQYPPASKQDSLVLSLSPSYVGFYFDTNMVYAPAAIYASSGQSAINVNLFWPKSKSSTNKGFAGYLIGYEDTTRTNPHVLWQYPPVLGSFDTSSGLVTFPAVVSANQSPPLERPYKFWVKTVRKDSVLSRDSIGISWSGAERFMFTDSLDAGVFLGNVNGQYGAKVLAANDASAHFTVHYDGTNVIVNAVNNTKLVNRADIAASLDGGNYFSGPFAVSDFSVTSVTLPPVPVSGGAVVYALLPDGSRARLFFQKGTNGYLSPTSTTSTVQISVSFQPASSNLPYF